VHIRALQEAALQEARETQAAKEKMEKSGAFMGYEEFMRFSVDFGITSSLGLTTLDVGDIYLCVCANQHFQSQIRNITFEDFWEALVRCGLHAFRHSGLKSNAVKVKALFLYVWRHIQTSIQEAMHGGNNDGGLSSYKGGLIRGAQLLNGRFLSMWAKDGYKNYLQTEKKAHKSISKFMSGVDGSSFLDHLAGAGTAGAKADGEGSGDDESTGNAADDENQRQIIVDIHDDDDVGDERINPALLRQLLLEKPELARLLYEQAEEAGLLDDDEADTLDASLGGRVGVGVRALHNQPFGGSGDADDDAENDAFGQEASYNEEDE